MPFQNVARVHGVECEAQIWVVPLVFPEPCPEKTTCLSSLVSITTPTRGLIDNFTSLLSWDAAFDLGKKPPNCRWCVIRLVGDCDSACQWTDCMLYEVAMVGAAATTRKFLNEPSFPDVRSVQTVLPN